VILQPAPLCPQDRGGQASVNFSHYQCS